MRKVLVTKQRTVNTYAELWQGSAFCLRSGLANPQGAAWHFLSSVLLTAFSFEAYLNHVGSEVLESWAELEKLSPLGKLRVLAEALSLQIPAAGTRPVQTLKELYLFRNTVAHGRSAEIRTEPAVKTVDNYQHHLYEPLLTDWERLVRTEKFAVKARTDAEAVMQLIQASRSDSGDDLFTKGLSHGTATLLDET